MMEKQQIDELLEQYKPLVIKNANRFFIMGGETQDLIQEGMIGLFHAIRDYDESKGRSFFYFADLCIRRQMYHAMEHAAGRSNMILNNSVRLEELEDRILPEYAASPEELIVDREDAADRLTRLKEQLSKLERKVLLGRMAGLDTAEIADRLGLSPKSIDNAMTRIKKKAEKI